MTTWWMIIAVLVLVGILLFKRWVDRQPDLTPEQVADVIDRFIDGADSEDFTYEWDDYIHIPSRNPALEQIRQECEEIPDKFPPEKKTEWCNGAGRIDLKRLAQKARQLPQPAVADNAQNARH